MIQRLADLFVAAWWRALDFIDQHGPSAWANQTSGDDER